MSTKLAWVRSFPSDCLAETNGMKAFQIATYVTLKWHMRKSGEPIFCDQDKLAHSAGCSKKIFNKALEFLLRDKKIICLDDGRLWSLQVEEELNNSNENLSKFSERAQKAAKARWDKNKDNSDDDAKDASSNAISNAQAMLNDANHNHNHNHIYNKKNKTIVLSKKEIDFEDLETDDLVEEPSEDDTLQSRPEQIEAGVENHPPIHEQENVSKKTKRSKANRGCRLPNDFEPDYDFALAEGLPPERIKIEIAKFRDYWRSKAGANATKIDWQATWRNWVRNSKKYEINQQGCNYGNFSKDQKTCGGTGETIRNLIRDAEFSSSPSKHCRSDGEIRHNGVSMDFDRWRAIDTSSRETSFRNLSDSSKLTYLESVC